MPSRASARTSRASMSAASCIVADGRSRADAACRGRPDASHAARPARPLSAASASQTPRARMMSPSNSSGPATFARLEIVVLGHREGQDVGRLVLAAPLGVERAHLARRRSGAPTVSTGRLGRRQAAGRRFRRSPLRRPCGRAAPRSVLLSHSSSASTAISSIIAPGPFIGFDDPPDERVADDVGGGEADHRDALDALELADRVGEAGLASGRAGRPGAGRRRSPSGCACRSGSGTSSSAAAWCSAPRRG